MTQPPKDDLRELVGADSRTTLMILILAALLFLPSLAPKIATKVVDQALALKILVPQDQAILTLPTTGAGLDAIRLALLILCALALAAGARARNLRASQQLPTK